MDHGSGSLGHSLRQIECARRAGVVKIVATPHYYMSDNISVPDFIEMRGESLDMLAANIPDGIEIIPAAEVRLSFDTPFIEQLPLLAVGGTKYILIEMPPGNWDSLLFDALLAVAADRGLKPVIAHIDRYPMRDFMKLLPFGFTFQINAESVCSFPVRRRLMPYIRSGVISVLGSDVHDRPERSYIHYSRAVRHLGSLASVMTERALGMLGEEKNEAVQYSLR